MGGVGWNVGVGVEVAVVDGGDGDDIAWGVVGVVVDDVEVVVVAVVDDIEEGARGGVGMKEEAVAVMLLLWTRWFGLFATGLVALANVLAGRLFDEGGVGRISNGTKYFTLLLLLLIVVIEFDVLLLLLLWLLLVVVWEVTLSTADE